MKIKNILAVLLIVCMLATVFAACDKKEVKEITEINYWIVDTGNSGSGSKVKMVENAINELCEKEIGVHVNFTWLSFGDYPTQLNLAIANKEPVDVAQYQFGNQWLMQYANGSMLDMSALIEEHGQELKATIGEELINVTSVDGGIYGIPTYRLLNAQIYIFYRTDILEKTNTLDMFKNLSSWSEYEEFMQILKAEESSMYPTGGGYEPVMHRQLDLNGDSFANATSWDRLGDPLEIIWSDQEGNVKNNYAREEVIPLFEMLADWYDKGLIYPDSAFATTSDANTTLIGQGVYAGSTCNSEFGVEVTKAQQAGGIPMTVLEVTDMYISTGNAHMLGMFIPASSAEPDAAMRFINFLYTSPELMTLFNWGIEGETYVKKDGVANFPEGTDASTCGYTSLDFMMGNQFITLPWEGNPGGADFRNLALENFQSARYSTYFGMIANTGGYETIIGTLNNVKQEYVTMLYNGAYSDGMLDEMLEKMEAAGIDEYVALFQTAVDEWMAK